MKDKLSKSSFSIGNKDKVVYKSINNDQMQWKQPEVRIQVDE